MKTFRGLISLFIAYMIFHGWAIIFFVVGTATANPWLIGVGSVVILFWFGPGTPVIPLIIMTALLIQRYVFFEATQQVSIKTKWKELNETYKENKKQ